MTIMRPFVLVLFILHSAAFFGDRSTVVAAPSDEEALENIAKVYSENREKLRSFTCRFKVTAGMAASATEGLAEKFPPKSIQNGLWIVRDGDVRYELRCAKGELTREELNRKGPDEILPNGRGISAGGDCSSSLELYSEKSHIRAVIGLTLNVVNLHEKGTTEVVKTPVSMGMLGPGEIYSPLFFIRGQQAGTSYCKYLGKSKLDGVEVDVMESGRLKTKDAEPHIVWHFDLARGGIPLNRSVINKDGSLRYETVATSIKRLDNGAYICERSVFLAKWEKGWKTEMIELTSMDLNPPARAMLEMTLPDDCKVICMKDLRQAVRVGKGEKMHVDDLYDWVIRCERRGE
jgi:hypothetical protein